MRRVAMVAMTLVLLSAAVFAGNGKKGGGAVDLATVRTVTGTVTAVSLNAGMGHPAFSMNTDQEGARTINLGPYFYLVAHNFSMAVGDEVNAKVANCAKAVVAFEVTDATSGKSIALRADDGTPLWTGGRRENGRGGCGNHGNGCRMGGYGTSANIDLSTLAEVEGTLASVGAGLGTHRNRVTLQAGENAYDVGLGPMWYLTQEGFQVQAGEAVRVRMARCLDHWAAFEVTRTATGQTILLRDDQGIPLWLD
jgi:hypothetical protein